MIKVTLPDGTIIEAGSAEEAAAMLSSLAKPHAPQRVPQKKELVPAGRSVPRSPWPHRIGSGTGAVKVGQLEADVVLAAKTICESAEDRYQAFGTAALAHAINERQNSVSQVMARLVRKGLLHKVSGTTWRLTSKAWSAKYWIVQPYRKS